MVTIDLNFHFKNIHCSFTSYCLSRSTAIIVNDVLLEYISACEEQLMQNDYFPPS